MGPGQNALPGPREDTRPLPVGTADTTITVVTGAAEVTGGTGAEEGAAAGARSVRPAPGAWRVVTGRPGPGRRAGARSSGPPGLRAACARCSRSGSTRRQVGAARTASRNRRPGGRARARARRPACQGGPGGAWWRKPSCPPFCHPRPPSNLASPERMSSPGRLRDADAAAGSGGGRTWARASSRGPAGGWACRRRGPSTGPARGSGSSGAAGRPWPLVRASDLSRVHNRYRSEINAARPPVHRLSTTCCQRAPVQL